MGDESLISKKEDDLNVVDVKGTILHYAWAKRTLKWIYTGAVM